MILDSKRGWYGNPLRNGIIHCPGKHHVNTHLAVFATPRLDVSVYLLLFNSLASMLCSYHFLCTAEFGISEAAHLRLSSEYCITGGVTVLFYSNTVVVILIDHFAKNRALTCWLPFDCIGVWHCGTTVLNQMAYQA